MGSEGKAVKDMDYYQGQQAPGQQPQGQPVYGQPVQGQTRSYKVGRIEAGVFALVLGAFGAHKFYLGYTTEAIIMLLVTLLTFGFGAIVMEIISLIEGIMYLLKSDEEFEQIYVMGKKGWF